MQRLKDNDGNAVLSGFTVANVGHFLEKKICNKIESGDV